MSTPSASPANEPVHGIGVTPLTQCAHWHSARDIIAIRHACCGVFYACIACHEALAGHAARVWPRESWTTTPAVRCGACRRVWTIAQYLACEARCPGCAAPFNPGCATHYHLYFDMAEETTPGEAATTKTDERGDEKG